jgi:hypothetical protein
MVLTTTDRSIPSLRRALAADAAVSGAAALLMLLAAPLLAGLTLLPAGLLRGAGLVLVPFVAWLVWLAAQSRPPRRAVMAVIVINALWVAASLLLLLGGLVTPNALGYVFVLAQAVAVAALAVLQLAGLREAGQSAANRIGWA